MKHRFVFFLGCGSLVGCAGILGIDDLPEQSSSGYTVSVVSGAGQSGQVGKALDAPVVVEVRDATGAIAAGRKVTFTASDGGGYFTDSVTPATDAQGRASIHWVLGPSALNELRATAEGATATVTATATDPWQLAIGIGLPVGRMFRDGVGDAARFGDALGITFGGDGKLYIGDGLAHTVRRLDPVSREVTTIAGAAGDSGITQGIGPAARFMVPYGVAREGNGALLVASTNAHVIQRVDLATAMVSVIAGGNGSGAGNGTGGAAQFNLPYAVDCDDARQVAYVADHANHVIREINLVNGAVKTLAGIAGTQGYADGALTEATFKFPTGITHNGNTLYVSDSANARIRQIDLDAGRVSTLSGAAGIEPAGGFVDGDKATARFHSIVGLTYFNRAVYVADRRVHAIRKVSVDDGSVTTIVGSPPSAGAKFGAVDAANGLEARLFQPHGVTVSADGTALYVTEAGGTDVRRVLLKDNYEVTTVAAKAVVPTNGDARKEAILDWPRGLALASDKLLVAETLGADIRQVDLKTNVVTRLAGADDERNDPTDGAAARFGYPTAIAIDETKGFAYLAGGDQLVRQIALATGETKTLAGEAWSRGMVNGPGKSARFNDVQGIAIDTAGQKLYLADTLNHRIRMLDLASADYRVSTVAGGDFASYKDGSNLQAYFHTPRALAFHDNALYVSDSGNHVLRRITLDENGYGEVITFAGNRGEPKHVDGALLDARFLTPANLVFQGDLLYVVDIDGNALRRIHIPSGTVSTLLGGPAGAPAGPGPLTMPKKPAYLAVRPSGEVLFSTYQENVVFRLGPS
ncbi:hypothetical protein LZC95_50655 [Pendulispora brunnea]|uniref:NHL repeat-containing protein n=1 Tax=Pendulispora brunnea TaxID=2905690 RepID=A0ABZ2K7K0_9BACT